MERINPLRRKLEAGGAGAGVLITMPSVNLARILAHAGFDYLFIDMEHGPIDVASAHHLIQAEASHWRSCRCAASSCVLPLVGIELPPAAIVECHGNIGPLRKKYRFTGGVHTASQLASQDSQFPPIRPNLHTEGTHCRQGNRGKSTASRLVGVHESGIQHPRLKVLSCALQRRWPTRTCGRGWRRRASTPT